MKIVIEIENREGAIAAQKMLSAYLGEEAPKAVAKKPEPEAKKPEPKEEKKVPAVRAKDEVKKDAKPTKPKPDPKPDPEEEEEAETSNEIDQATLTQIAKEAVARTDRATVKETIGEYGEKISAVAEEDYAELAAKLKELGAE